MKRGWLALGAILFAALFLFSGSRVLGWLQESSRSRQDFAQVEALLGTSQPQTGISGEGDGLLEQYVSVYEQNPDFVGWITVEGTRVNYPVMQSPEDPDFYLEHDFEKQPSEHGVPYVQADCDVLTSDNLVIYGHHKKDKTMFSDLCKYKTKSFYEEHRTFRFDTRYSCGTYEVIAVFKTSGGEGGFPYHHFVDAESEQAFNDFVAACKSLSLYEIEATAQYGDRLVTLSTCEYSRSDGRMVIVAKKIAEEP